jgi:hypothetical protein
MYKIASRLAPSKDYAITMQSASRVQSGRKEYYYHLRKIDPPIINGSYFPVIFNHLIFFFNNDVMCFSGVGNWVLKYYVNQVYASKCFIT